MIIRDERSSDAAAVRAIHEAAFARPDEADLVEALRREGAVLCALVAEENGRAVGHVLFTRMWIGDSVAAVALAPVAVLPDEQRSGIGSRLIREGLNRLRDQRERIVLVLGEPEYYSRFGFSAEKALRLRSPFPPEAFLALELEPDALTGVEGRVRYASAFAL